MSNAIELDINPQNAACLLDKWVLQDYADGVKNKTIQDHPDFRADMNIYDRIKLSASMGVNAMDYKNHFPVEQQHAVNIMREFLTLQYAFFVPLVNTKAICVKPSTAIMMTDTLNTSTYDDLNMQIGDVVFVDFNKCGLTLHNVPLQGAFLHHDIAGEYRIFAITDRVETLENYGRPKHKDNITFHRWAAGTPNGDDDKTFEGYEKEYQKIDDMLLITILAEKQLKPTAKPKLPNGVPPRTKPRELQKRAKKFTLFSTVSLSIRGADDYAKSRGTGNGTKHTRQTIVRGFNRRQRYGTGRKLTKVIWIAPFIRGSGLKISKQTVL